MPSLDFAVFNQDYTAVYSSYDNTSRGKIKVCNYQEKPKVIIENENVFGPLRIEEKMVNNQRKREILYFTYEKNKVRVKICDINGTLLKDITNMLL